MSICSSEFADENCTKNTNYVQLQLCLMNQHNKITSHEKTY